jgi:membrane protease YdiL (CAAX protease family)
MEDPSMNSRTRVVGIVAYLVLAFGIGWGSWELLLPSAKVSQGLFALLALPGAFAPALATFIVRKWITREGFADAGLALNLSKWRYYLIAWFLPFLGIGFILTCAPLLGFPHPDFSLSNLGAQANVPHALQGLNIVVVTLVSLTVTALLATPVLFGEEFGWRGYLQLRLFPERPTLAAIATGIIWGAWHWPAIVRGYEFGGDPIIVTGAFCVGAVLSSIIFGWLREKSGSVWVTSLAHSATNAIGGSVTALWFPDRSDWIFVSYLGVLGWIPLALVCALILAGRARRGSAAMASA